MVRLGPGVPGLEPGLSFAGIDRWTMAIQRLPNKPSRRKKISRVLEQEMAAALAEAAEAASTADLAMQPCLTLGRN